MENSIMIAKVMGPVCIVVGIGIAINLKFYQKMIADFCNNGALLYFAGAITLALGLFMAQVHDFSLGGWYILVSVICVMTILKGVVLIVFPKIFVKIAEKYKYGGVHLVIHIGLAIIFGLILTIMGYCCG